MDNLLFFLLLLSLICIPVGLIKPSLFNKLFKRNMTRKKVITIFGIASIVLFFAFVFTADPVVNVQEDQTNRIVDVQNDQIAFEEDNISDDTQKEPTEEEVNEVNESIVEPNPEIDNENINEQPPVIPEEDSTNEETDNENINEQPPVIPEEESANEEIDQPTPQTDREIALVILKENAKQDWGEDYEMVQYEYENQVEAYDWVMAQTEYSGIMSNAKQDWGEDYEMVQYEYENQVEAYEWIIAQTEYPNIMSNAQDKWGDDYEMVQYEYENQVEAYNNL